MKLLSTLAILVLCLSLLIGCNPIAQTKLGANFFPGVSVSQTNSSIRSSASKVASHELLTISLDLKDQANNSFISDLPVVEFRNVGGTSTGSFGPVARTNDGTYTSEFRGEQAGTPTKIFALVNGERLASSSLEVRVTPGFYDLDLSEVQLSSSAVHSGTAITATVIVRDEAGNQLSNGGLAVTFSAAGGSSTVSFSSVTDHNDGSYSVSVTGIIGGTPTLIQAQITGNRVKSIHPSLTVSGGSPTSISVFSGNNQSSVVASALGLPLVAVVKDLNNNVLPNVQVDWIVSANNGSLSSLTGQTNSSGESQSILTLGSLSGNNTVSATVRGTPFSTTFSATGLPSVPTQLLFTTNPSAVGNADSALTVQPILETKDSYGNTIPSFAGAITLSAYSDSTCATLVAGGVSASVNPLTSVSGIASFAGVRIMKTSVKSLRATDGTRSTCFDTLTISPGAVSSLTFSTQPSSVVTAGQAFGTQPVVALYDAQANLVTTSSANVVISLISGTGTLSGTKTITASSGVATFSGLSIDLSGVKTLRATVGPVVQISTSITINTGTTSALVFTQSPATSGNSDSSLSTQPVIEARDSYGNLATTYQNGVSFTGYSDSSCATPVASGLQNPTVTSSNGVATWTGLKILKTNIIALRASDGSVSSACLTGFSIAAGAVSTVTFSTHPSVSTVAGVALSTQPVVTFYDANSNLATNSSLPVTVALTSGTGTLSGTKTINAVSGVATFTDLSLNLVGTNKVLTATVNSVTGVSNSSSITPAAFSLSQSTVASASATLASGTSVVVTVTGKDSFGNLNPTGITAVTFSSTTVGGTGSFGATTNAGSGVYTASFTGIVSGSVTLSGAVNGSTVSSTASVTVNYGSVSGLVFSTPPSASGNADTALAAQPVVTAQDANGNVIGNYTSSITLTAYTDASCTSSIGSGVSALTNPLSATAGVASFTSLRILKTTAIALGASDGTRSVCSGPLAISAGAAASIVISNGNSPTQSAAHGSALSAFTVLVKDANLNPVPGKAVAWAVTSGGGSLSSTSNATLANGTSSSTLTLGVAPGSNTVTATVSSTAFSVTFTATSTTSALSKIWPFDVGTSASYIYTPSLIDFSGGLVSLKGNDQVDDANDSPGFADSLATGIAWDLTNTVIRLAQSGTPTNTAEFDSSWTPQWSALVGYWKLNGAVGSVATATSVTAAIGNNGTSSNLNGSGLSYISGKFNQGMSFDAVDDSVIIPHNVNQVQLPLTIQAWVRSTTVNQGSWKAIISKYPASSSNGWSVDTNGGNYYFYYMRNSTDKVFPGSYGMSLGTASLDWAHIVIVIDTTGAKTFRDGILMQTQSWTGTPGNSTQSAQLQLGRITPSGAQMFSGSLDEVAIWNASLSDSEVQLLYSRQSAKYSGVMISRVMDALSPGQSWTGLNWKANLPFLKEMPDAACTPVGPATTCAHANSESSGDYPTLVGSTGSTSDNNLMSGLVGLWHLNETTATAGAGNDFADSSGNFSSGESVSGVTFNQNGKFNKSVRFTGSNSIAITPNFTLTGTATFSFWINALQLESQSINYPLSFGTSNTLRFGVALGGNYTDSQVPLKAIGLYSGVTNLGSATVASTFTQTANTNRWHHITVTYDKNASPRTKIYVDGLLPTRYSDNVTGDLPTFNQLYLGRRPDGMPFYLNGFLDEVAIWNRVLAPSEVGQLYRRGANRIKYQVRKCTTSTCSDDSTGANWKGPDGTNLTYFSELNNNTVPLGGGTVKKTSPALLLSAFTNPVGTSQYFQYRSILESDDTSTSCNYGSGATWCSPELKSVTVDPVHYPTSATIVGTTAASFYSVSSLTESVGVGCAAGIGYNIGLGASAAAATWYYWNGAAWSSADGSATQSNSQSAITAQLATAGTSLGNVYFRAFLKSTGSTSCTLDNLQLDGQQ